MLFLITLIFCLIVTYFIFAPKSMIMCYFSFYAIGFTFIVFSSLLFVFKLSNYPNLYEFDYTMYLYLSRFSLSLSTARLIFTLGIVIILLSNVFFINITKKLRKQSLFANILYIIPVIIYFLLNHSGITQLMYIIMHTSESEIVRGFVSGIQTFTGYYGKFLIILYHIIPIFYLIQHYLHTNITVKKQSLIITITCTLLLYVNMFHTLFGDLNTYFMLDFNNFPIHDVRISKYMLMLMLFLFVITLIFSLLIFFRPFRSFTVTSAKIMRQKSTASSVNLRMFLHTQKNLFVTISKFANLELDECESNPQHACDNFKIIKGLADNTIDNLAKNLDMLRSVKIAPQIISVYSIIDDVTKNTNIPKNVTVDKEYPTEPLYCAADADALCEVFTNVISNSLEAIDMAQRSAGKISIQVTYDYDLICISVTDNGCGIDKKNMKFLFEPLFSTKSSQTNYGLGLSYSKEILRQHNGYITISGTQGVETKVQIVLPRTQNKHKRKGFTPPD